jgi:Flp pilus assembly protein TadD
MHFSSPEPVEEAPSMNGVDPILRVARDDLSRGDLSKALHGYGHLIRRGRSIEEILPDLARLVREHPREAQAWQTLGDALACAGRQEHADQSYERARKLRH